MPGVPAVLIPALVWLLADAPRAPDSHVIALSAAAEQTCPAAKQVTDALALRLPGVILPLGLRARPGMLRLTVAGDATGIRIDLTDPDGAPLLHRMIAVARGPSECAALADTIALIIERYWREVGYDAPPLQPPTPPPPPPPPPTPPEPPPEPARAPPASVEKQAPAPAATASVPLRLAIAAALAGRAGDAGTRDASAMIAFSAESRVGVRLSGGVSNGASATLNATEQASFRRFPLRLGAYLPISLGAAGHLEPGVGVNLDLVSVSVPANGTQLGSPCSGQWCRSPGADLALGWSLASLHHVYVRALGRAGLSASYDFVTTPKGDPVWRTPSTYLELAVESGLWFP
jgi:hypothetical protein